MTLSVNLTSCLSSGSSVCTGGRRTSASRCEVTPPSASTPSSQVLPLSSNQYSTVLTDASSLPVCGGLTHTCNFMWVSLLWCQPLGVRGDQEVFVCATMSVPGSGLV